jgi:hypothetical protein
MSQHESSMSSRYARDFSGSTASRMGEGVRDYLGQGLHTMEDMVTNHPATSGLVIFGVGLGLGLLIGQALMSGMRQPTTRWLDRRRAEKFGRQVLDAISEYLPQPLASRLG